MERGVDVVERLQRLFAESTGYSIWLVTKSGEPVTRPVFANMEGAEVYESNGKSLVPLASGLAAYGTEEGPVLLDCGDTGWQIVVTLLRLDASRYYYICTGPARLEDSKRKLVLRTEEFKQLLIAFYQQGDRDEASKQQAQTLERLAGVIQKGGIDERGALDVLMQSGFTVDFAGFAAKGPQYQYTVTHTAGEWGSRLQDASFFAGEGYLGQVAVTGQASWWNPASRDPRMRFFAGYDMQPTQLFCSPVKRNGTNTGLLFFGLVTSLPSKQADLYTQWGSLVGAVLSEGLAMRQLKDQLDVQLDRMRTLMELAAVLASVGELKRVMYMLVDSALSLIQGAVSSICIVRSPETGKVQMVSRGLEAEEADRCGKRLAAKHLKMPLGLGNDGADRAGFIDRAIVFQQEVLGVIAVDCGADESAQEELDLLLDTLADIASVAVDRALSGRARGKQRTSLLYDAMLQLDPAKSAVIAEAREWAAQFGRYMHLGAEELRQIDEAISVLGYDLEFLRGVPVDEEILELVADYRRITKEDAASGEHAVEAKIMYHVVHHVSTGSRPAGKFDPSLDDEVSKQFRAYLVYRDRMSKELVPDDDDPDSDLGTAFASLSPRELAVLKLIAEGSSNKAIAETLYISEHTVKNHITNIFGKLGVTDRSHLIAMVYRSGSRAKLSGSME